VTQYYTGTRPHAVTSTSDGKAFDYDANGNMTDRDGQTLTWDAENRLTEVVSGTTTVRFSYDGQGRRVKKEVVSGTTTETTIYIGPHFEVAVSGTQTISTSYYYALGRAVAMRTKEGVTETVYYLHGDHLGSTSVVSDEDGNEVGRASYYPFGEVYTATGTLARAGKTSWVRKWPVAGS
jgi:YD repeat-containing protein